jgi:hypothetical protein
MATDTKEEDQSLDNSIFHYERTNPYMEHLYKYDTFVVKKKANYLDRITLSLVSTDNVYKIYDWNEKQVQKGIRLIKFK